ncbi:MAG: RelA/SpoT AH/RIS domain-containing protein, partial [Pseudomonadota bacterium]
AQRPKPVWLNMVSTGRARGAIRRTLLAEERDEAARLGEKIVERVFERADAAFSGKALSAAATRLGQPDAAGVLAEVARGRIAAADVLAAVYPDKAVGDGAQDQSAPGPGQLVPSENGAQVVLGRGAAAADGAVGEGRVTIPTACCCRPIPGERIVGLAEPGVGVRVHAINCPRLEAYEDAMDLWLDLAWAPEASARPSHLTSVLVTLSNEAGALGGTATLIAEAGCNIDLVETVDRKPDYYRLRFDLLVRDIRHLSNLLTTLNAQPAVAEAVRTPPPRRSDSEALEPGPQRRAAPRASPPASAPEQTAESAGGGDPAATPPPATISETTPI